MQNTLGQSLCFLGNLFTPVIVVKPTNNKKLVPFQQNLFAELYLTIEYHVLVVEKIFVKKGLVVHI